MARSRLPRLPLLFCLSPSRHGSMHWFEGGSNLTRKLHFSGFGTRSRCLSHSSTHFSISQWLLLMYGMGARASKSNNGLSGCLCFSSSGMSEWILEKKVVVLHWQVGLARHLHQIARRSYWHYARVHLQFPNLALIVFLILNSYVRNSCNLNIKSSQFLFSFVPAVFLLFSFLCFLRSCIFFPVPTFFYSCIRNGPLLLIPSFETDPQWEPMIRWGCRRSLTLCKDIPPPMSRYSAMQPLTQTFLFVIDNETRAREKGIKD